MFNRKSSYALNKKDPNAIVYMDANEAIIRLTREDFASEKEFLKWKALSDEDYHASEKEAHVYRHLFLFSDADADVDSDTALSHALAASQGFGAGPVGFSAGCPVATLRPCLLSLRDLCDANDADDAVCEISHLKSWVMSISASLASSASFPSWENFICRACEVRWVS